VHLQWDTHYINLQDLHVIVQILGSIALVEWPRPGSKGLGLLAGEPPINGLLVATQIDQIQFRRRVWQEDKDISLVELLDSARWAYSTDPRDKVFALCGLSDLGLGIVPDYQATIEEIYISSAATVMKQGRSLDLLAFCNHTAESNSKTLPNWCPDWSSKPNEQLERARLLFSVDTVKNTFNASRDTYFGLRMELEDPRKGS
jgi:hypothetical protein